MDPVILVLVLSTVLIVFLWVCYKASPSSIAKNDSANEIRIHKILCHNFGEKNVVKNVYLNNINISFVAVSKKGLVIVEPKDCSGSIFGGGYAVEWTQTLRNGNKLKFGNPIWKNEEHIKTIEQFLAPNFKDLTFFNIVVFDDSCEIKNDINPGELNTYVIQTYWLHKIITSRILNKSDIFNDDETETILNEIKPLSKPTKVAEKLYFIKEDKKVIEFPVQTGADLKCPMCDGTLFIKTNWYEGNKYYCCDRFPRCSYTEGMWQDDVNKKNLVK